MSGQTFAAIMGDLVASERALAVDALHGRFNAAVAAGNDAHAGVLASPLTITLGDEFQGLATTLAGAALIARDLRLALLKDGIDCRFAIGLVTLSTPLNRDRAWNMMGPGLARTRERLNEKRSASRYRFVLGDHRLVETLLEALGAGITAIERRWTDRQRGDVAAALAGVDAEATARARNVSPHSVYKVRAAGEREPYAAQWSAVLEALATVDRQERLA